MERLVVTGASRGIGRAVAQRLAAPGRELVLHGRDEEALGATACAVAARGAAVRALLGDLADASEVRRLAAAAGEAPVHSLINCAGVAVVKPLAELSDDEWQRSLAVNVTAPFLLVRLLLPRLGPGSSVVNVLSIAARRGFAGWSAYCAAKFALEGLSQSLREELRPAGVRVINVYPAATDTELWRRVPGEWDRERMIPAVEVAEAIAFALARPQRVSVDCLELGDISGSL